MIIVSPIWRVERDVLGDLAFPAIAIRQQPFLVVVELLARLGRELEVRPLDDGIDRARLLAQPAIDALHHVDVVAGGAPRAVVAARPRLDGDRLCRTDRLAQLAGDATLLTVRIAAQRVLAAEARRQRPLLERVVERRLRLEEVAHRQDEGLDELLQEQRAGSLIQSHDSILRPSCPASSPPPRTPRYRAQECPGASTTAVARRSTALPASATCRARAAAA